MQVFLFGICLGISQCKVRSTVSLPKNQAPILEPITGSGGDDLAYDFFNTPEQEGVGRWPDKPFQRYRLTSGTFDSVTLDVGKTQIFNDVGGGVRKSQTSKAAVNITLYLIKSVKNRQDGGRSRVADTDPETGEVFFVSAQENEDGSFSGDVDAETGRPISFIYYCEYKATMSLETATTASLRAFIAGIAGSRGTRTEVETAHWSTFFPMNYAKDFGNGMIKRPTPQELYNACVNYLTDPTIADFWGLKGTSIADVLTEDLKLLSSTMIENAADTACIPSENVLSTETDPQCQDWYNGLGAPKFYIEQIKPVGRCVPIGTGSSGNCSLVTPENGGCSLYAKPAIAETEGEHKKSTVDWATLTPERRTGYRRVTIGLEGYPCDIGTTCEAVEARGVVGDVINFLQSTGQMGLRAKCKRAAAAD